jgi:glycosyltransferase involved in cell wall biosynthesis
MHADLLHCPSFVTPWKVSVPFVVTIFDLSTRRFAADHPLEWRLYERWMLPSRVRSARRVITISDLTRKDVIRVYGARPDRVVTVYPGVDDHFFDRSRPPASDEPLLLFPGAPVARKNLNLVLEAMASASSATRLSRACLQISGTGPTRFPEHVARIRALGLEGRVEWLGVVPAERMPGVMRQADACVYPSFYEGFGFPPLEAMASGTPVVASNVSCLPEVLGDAAVLIDPNDVHSFSKAAERVLSDADFRDRLVQGGRLRAARFTWESCAEQTMAVYRQALAAS